MHYFTMNYIVYTRKSLKDDTMSNILNYQEVIKVQFCRSWRLMASSDTEDSSYELDCKFSQDNVGDMQVQKPQVQC